MDTIRFACPQCDTDITRRVPDGAAAYRGGRPSCPACGCRQLQLLARVPTEESGHDEPYRACGTN